MGFFSPLLATMNSYYSSSAMPQPPAAGAPSYGDYYSLPRQQKPTPLTASGTPVILNVFAPAPSNSNYCTLQSVHYGTLPVKRSSSIKSTKSQEKATPGLDQIMKWVKNKREQYKAGRRSSASAVSSSSTLKEPPPGILRNSRRDYSNFLDSLPRPHRQHPQHQHQQQQQQFQHHNPLQQHQPRNYIPTMSLPPTNRQWSTLRRTSEAYYGYDPVYDENDEIMSQKRSFDSYRDYYPRGTIDRLERYEPSLTSRSSMEVPPPPMLHRYPPSYIEPPVDYSCSSTSSSSSSASSDESPTPATKVRFQCPKPEDIQYIKNEEEEAFSPSTLQKFEKIYQKFKPNFIKKSAAKKSNSIDSTEEEEDTPSTSTTITSGPLENDDTDSTTSVATIHLPTKIVIEDDLDEGDNEGDTNDKINDSLTTTEGDNVFFFGETRIDYQCQRVGNNMVVHYTSRKIASNNGKVASKIQRRGVITDIEYGPGIVQKLREKFSKMASSIIETAQISPHAKQKKFPSVDDILSEGEKRMGEYKRNEFNDQTQMNPPRPYYYFHQDTTAKPSSQIPSELPSSPPLPSRSQSQPPPPKSPPLPPQKIIDEHERQQESPRAVVEKTPLGPISALRAKFEKQAAARAHAFGNSRQNFGARSQSVNTLKQFEVKKEKTTAIPKSSENIHHTYQNEEAPVRFVPKIPEKRPTGFLPPPIPESQQQFQKRENLFGTAPKPVRVMDLISPPADPTPKEYQHHHITTSEAQLLPHAVSHSPASSTASSDRSPPPEEPRIIPQEIEEEEAEEEEVMIVENEPPFLNHHHQDAYEQHQHHYQQHQQQHQQQQQYRTQAIQDDRSNERLAFAAIQRQKMTLTLPIGTSPQHHRFLPPSDLKIGKPGSTPITGPSKLKLPNDNSGISEVQKLLNKFSAIREQKMQETPPSPPRDEEERTIPTAIVPPVVQQPQPPPQYSSFQFSPNNYQDSKGDSWKIEEKQQQQQQNIISINIGHQHQHQQFGYNDEGSYLERDDPSTTTTHHHHHIGGGAGKQRMAPLPPPPPPPLPPRGGTDQQQQQRKSLTSRWLESKQDSDEEGSGAGGIALSDQSGQDQYGGHPKPYGDNETIEEQTRRSIETMSVVKEQPEEEEVEDVGSVRLLSRRTLEDDNVTLHRSDFLKTSFPYDSSESEEDDHPNAHLAAYGIHRLGIYEAPNASDGNPVRHSLLNLVAEEDIPELLQAMAEECHFVFDDCDRSNMPTTSGIIHTPAKRMERRKQRNVDRICFEEKSPEVFAYADETTAYEEGEWSEGFPISYEEYKQIVETAQQEATQQQHMDLANWRMLMEQKFSIQDEQIRALTEQQQMQDRQNIENSSTSIPSSSSSLSSSAKQQRDEELGVTSTYLYSTSSTPLQQCAQPLNLRQASDRETSAM